jgi:hypothetical protein
MQARAVVYKIGKARRRFFNFRMKRSEGRAHYMGIGILKAQETYTLGHQKSPGVPLKQRPGMTARGHRRTLMFGLFERICESGFKAEGGWG